MLQSFLRTLWRAHSCYLLTRSWCLSIWCCKDQQLYPCSVRTVFQWIPALWSGRHSSRLRSGFCPAVFRLLSFRPDCSDCSSGRMVGVVLSFFPSCLQYCSTGIYEVCGVGVRSAALDLSVELPEVSGCCVSVENVTEILLHRFHRIFSATCFSLHRPLSWTLLSFPPCAL